MKVESRTIIGASLILAMMAGGYWGLVATHGHSAEYSGVLMLIFSFSAYGILGAYLLAQYFRRHRIPRPEDRFDATQEDGAGVIDYFPAASIWPVGLGLGMIFGGVALVWGIWYLYIGALLFFGSVFGWVTESDYSMDVLPGIDPSEVELGHDVPSGATLPHFHTETPETPSQARTH